MGGRNVVEINRLEETQNWIRGFGNLTVDGCAWPGETMDCCLTDTLECHHFG